MEADYKLIIFDADGTLRRCTIEGQPCPNAPGEWELMPNVKETLAKFDCHHYGIASNQAGVALGYMTGLTAIRLLEDLFVEIFGKWPTDRSIRMCPHAPDEKCGCRKPEPAMLQELMELNCVLPDETLYVGDMESDKQAAENAGCHFMWAREFFDWTVV